MRRVLFAAAAVAALTAALSCGSSPMMMMDVPVKNQPLAGTINGKPFTAVSATASAYKAFSDGGERWIDIYDKQIDCTAFAPQVDREIIGTVPWQVANYNFSFSHNLTLVYDDDAGTPQNDVVTDGRLELLETGAPDAGLATLRIRANFNSNNNVEGEIKVQVCD